MSKLTVAICTYNRAERLPKLIAALRQQRCAIPFEILVINNNSSDRTAEVLATLANESGVSLRPVLETQQGIVFARNRALDESSASDYLVFIDDDELPLTDFLQNAVAAFQQEGADCVGGPIHVRFASGQRPDWLSDSLLGFLGELDHGREPLWITDFSTPLWNGNIGYRLEKFRALGLRFDTRYNRQGKAIGGGEDVMMFRNLLDHKVKIRYRPDMVIEHFIEEWRLTRRYFLKVHYSAGRRDGQYGTSGYARTFLGIPLFMLPQTVRHAFKAALMWLKSDPETLRQAMNGAHALGLITGNFLRWKKGSAHD